MFSLRSFEGNVSADDREGILSMCATGSPVGSSVRPSSPWPGPVFLRPNRDLKPENFLFKSQDDDAELKVCGKG